jgi:protein O-mannosyl-transferase
MAGFRPSRRRALAAALLAAATVIAFAAVVHNGFLDYDDDEYVTLNPHVRSGLTAHDVGWACTTFHGGTWQPLTWLLYMLEWQWFGERPAAFHATSLLLHLGCVLALFVFLDRMTGATGRSAFVAALFAVHPLHVQPVAWIACLKDVLSTLL